MRILCFFSTAILLIAGMICLVSCSRDTLVNHLIEAPVEDHRGVIEDHQVVKEDAYVGILEISISESRPAQVIVTAVVSHPDTCMLGAEIYQERKENTVFLWATKTIQHLTPEGLPIACGALVTSIEKQVPIGEFTVGEYTVTNGDIELGFRIEDDESWIIRNEDITNFWVLLSEGKPAQVTVNVVRSVWEECTAFRKIHQVQEGNTVTIQITTEVPSGVRCPSKFFEERIQVHEQFSIGTFPIGEYKVIIDGLERGFRID